VELIAWHVGLKREPDSTPEYSLQWHVYELRGGAIEFVTREVLDTSRWPAATLAPDFDTRFHVEMIRSGHVRWRMDGAPPKHGWIMLPNAKQ
jgi:hypothetical protein